MGSIGLLLLLLLLQLLPLLLLLQPFPILRLLRLLGRPGRCLAPPKDDGALRDRESGWKHCQREESESDGAREHLWGFGDNRQVAVRGNDGNDATHTTPRPAPP